MSKVGRIDYSPDYKSVKDQEWIDAGFTVERCGPLAIYSRSLSEEVLRMCALLSGRRQTAEFEQK